MAERENARLLHEVKSLLDKNADLRAHTVTMSGSNTGSKPSTSWDAWDPVSLSLPTAGCTSSPLPPVVDITIPKAYKTQVQALPLQAFEGATDVETVYLYLKQLDNRVRLVRTFSDAQRIEYAISYMSGAAHRWATDDWYPKNPRATWAQFITAFKARWVPANAALVLSGKLERLELKGTEIDRINDVYRATLELLGFGDLSKIGESDQYYQMYLRKIRDPAIINTISHLSLTTGGLDLDTLLKYTATLMVRKLASQPAKVTPTPPPGKESARTNPSRPTKKAGRVSVQAIEETTAEEEKPNEQLNAVTDARTSKPRSPPFNARRCYFCEDPGHIQSECPAKKELMARLKSGKV
ncbi:hypothetical protein BJ508DRAFT_322331 [Ascobolus immersus RN42]|uniref:CCHC-type domain-containing protein n=1 Tax=Ascobolus immersus RN42 TaxID=1160509 RepID=A0A3N4ILY8_ASCIM|nr:hypothetical protein BJ508DRAFT_322331 [Ascobolus immersus RN42]